MEGRVLRVICSYARSFPLCTRARFEGWGPTCRLRGLGAWWHLPLCGLFVSCCTLVTDGADCSRTPPPRYNGDVDLKYDVPGPTRTKLHKGAKTTMLPILDQSNSPITDDASSSRTRSAKSVPGSNLNLRSTCDEDAGAVGRIPVTAYRKPRARRQEDANAGTTSYERWQERLKRRWDQFKRALRRGRRKSSPSDSSGKDLTPTVPSSPSSGSTALYRRPHGTGGVDTASACKKPQPKLQALWESGNGFTEQSPHNQFPFPSALRSSFRRYMEKMPPWMQDRALRWTTGTEDGSQWESPPSMEHSELLTDDTGGLVPDEAVARLGDVARIAAQRRKAKYSDDALSEEAIQVRSQLSGAVYKLTLQERLGSGAGGIVFAADAERNSRSSSVAVKIIYKKGVLNTTEEVLEERFMSRILRETALLYHMPGKRDALTISRRMHIAFPLDIVTADDSRRCPESVGTIVYSCVWIIMQRFSSSLNGILHHAFNAQDLVAMTRQMIASVTFMHSLHLLHNDIKCGNYLVSEEGLIYLGDFGMATAADKEGLCHMGTMPYMAPERLTCMVRGLRRMKLTAKQDSWSLGISLFYVWCDHKHPFLQKNKVPQETSKRDVAAMYRDVIQKTPLDFSRCPHKIPAAVAEVIQALLRVDKHARAAPVDIYINSALFRKPIPELLKDHIAV